MAVKLLLNFSLYFALVAAPVFLGMALWYRRQLGRPALSWNVPEMVVVTIVVFITSLLLMIVAVSCFFSYWGLLDNFRVKPELKDHFLQIGTSASLLLMGVITVYLAMRKLMVQMIMEKGILVFNGLLPFPSSINMVRWENVVDYFQQSDYPNVVFHLIVDNNNLRFEKMAIRVPVFLKDDFLACLDGRMYTAQNLKNDSNRISSRFFTEN